MAEGDTGFNPCRRALGGWSVFEPDARIPARRARVRSRTRPCRLEEFRPDHPNLASYLPIEERELVAGEA